MPRRARRALPLVVATLAAVAPARPARAEHWGVVTVDAPRAEAARVVAREWGVWKVRRGTVAHLEELAAETPPWVLRAPGVPAPLWAPPPPRPAPPPVLFRPLPPPRPALPPPPPWELHPHPRPARKPVIFFHVDRPVDIRVEVAFRGGGPWLHYPAATVESRPEVGGALVWRCRAVPNARAPLAPAPRGHFWHELRRAGGDLLLEGSGTAERFLFYDGPVAFQRPFAVARRGRDVAVAPRSTEEVIWIVMEGRYVESRVGPRHRRTTIGRGDMEGLRARLAEALASRGLSEAEASSLLDTWRDDLFDGAGARAISLVPRDLYDSMLPLRIDPEPAELVRVGLVIEELDEPGR